MVALNARRVVSLNIKPDTSYFSVANCNVPLTAMTQIGDVILIKVSPFAWMTSISRLCLLLLLSAKWPWKRLEDECVGLWHAGQ